MSTLINDQTEEVSKIKKKAHKTNKQIKVERLLKGRLFKGKGKKKKRKKNPLFFNIFSFVQE